MINQTVFMFKFEMRERKEIERINSNFPSFIFKRIEMTTPSKSTSTPSKQRRTPGSTQRTRRKI